jgi:hypothetical protein
VTAGTIRMSRYDLFRASGAGGVYSVWLHAKLNEWAAESGRADEMRQERADGWQFPILCSVSDHAAFDMWLRKKVLP